MKTLVLALATLIGLATVLPAQNGNATAQRTGVVLFKTGSATAVTYTPSTTVGPGNLIKKMMLYPNAAFGGSVTITAWDAPSGLTYSSGAYQITPTIYGLIPSITAYPGPYVIDFTDQGKDSIKTGYKIKNFLVLEVSGAVSPSAQVIYEFVGTNPRQP